ncbi:serine acetyltransferase [Martelella alba]|uniref:Serine acetyltransferase n=1 Tax=Martelella alba TaxID=2590451 RepID=A0ABY2SL87_9HYPH|nr:serine acetyltransferase [Martelella alba]TKI05770.1 serine acetyltransferase [Martelella alba]
MNTLKETFNAIRLESKKNDSLRLIILLIFFRLTYYVRYKRKNNKLLFIAFFPFYLLLFIIFRLYSTCICACDLYPGTQIGIGLVMYHGFAVVIHPEVKIGENCIIRQGVTIGNKVKKDGSISRCPNIGNNVEFGANSIVIGEVKIGDNCKIGAGVVVTRNIQTGSIVIPAKMININGDDIN